MTDMNHPAALALAWIKAKKTEADAVAVRRAIEDQLAEFLDLSPSSEGVKTALVGEYTIKATQRITKKCDSAIIQKLAADNGIGYDIMQQLFRWKPELNQKAFNSAPANIIKIFTPAIIAQASRPTFQISAETLKE